MVMDFVMEQKKPVTRDDLIEKFGKTHKSLQYETHASITLNSLVKKGFLGRSKIEGTIYFMLPEDAVSHTLSVMGKLACDIKTAEDILEICKITGMPGITVISVLAELGS
jgi:predicted transcriptional regulator